MLTISRGICLLVGIIGAASAQMLPDSLAFTTGELEHLYFDYDGPEGFKATIVPCTKYLDLSGGGVPNNSFGRETAAEWIRTAFHDVVTADVAAGTGGLDASIGFETSRPENVGIFINDTLSFFAFFVNAKVSMADMIALGVATAVGGCGGPQIPLRVGRIDAVGPGPSGVPEPETDIHTTLADFSRAGFSQEDAIGLTVCGHTMGGVHHSTFPQIVPESAVGVNNSDGRLPMDTTVAVFDVNGVQEYLDGTGYRGGPLVTTSNQTVRSDLRLFSSDGNATVRKLGQSANQFRTTCTTLISQMLDTVPKHVTLTPVLDPYTVAYSNLTLNVDWCGEMTLAGFLRYIVAPTTANSLPSLPSSSMEVTIVDQQGHRSATSVKATTDYTNYSNNIYGPTYHYAFTASFSGSSGLSGIQVDNQQFPLQDSLFVIPTMSSVSPGIADFNLGAPAHEFTLNITAALRSSDPPPTLKGTFAYTVPQPGTLSPKIDTSTTVQLGLIGRAGPFAIYSVVTKQNLSSAQLFSTSIDIVDEKSGAEAMFFKLYSLLTYF